jgi:hypothetical protein
MDKLDRHYRATTSQEAAGSEVAFHYRIHEAGLKIQN